MSREVLFGMSTKPFSATFEPPDHLHEFVKGRAAGSHGNRATSCGLDATVRIRRPYLEDPLMGHPPTNIGHDVQQNPVAAFAPAAKLRTTSLITSTATAGPTVRPNRKADLRPSGESTDSVYETGSSLQSLRPQQEFVIQAADNGPHR